MTHPLVEQLRFARSEFRRGLRGFPEADYPRPEFVGDIDRRAPYRPVAGR